MDRRRLGRALLEIAVVEGVVWFAFSGTRPDQPFNAPILCAAIVAPFAILSSSLLATRKKG